MKQQLQQEQQIIFKGRRNIENFLLLLVGIESLLIIVLIAQFNAKLNETINYVIGISLFVIVGYLVWTNKPKEDIFDIAERIGNRYVKKTGKMFNYTDVEAAVISDSDLLLQFSKDNEKPQTYRLIDNVPLEVTKLSWFERWNQINDSQLAKKYAEELAKRKRTTEQLQREGFNLPIQEDAGV